MKLNDYPEPEIRPLGADDAPTILLDPSRTFRDFGEMAFTPLDEIVAKTVAYYQNTACRAATPICAPGSRRDRDSSAFADTAVLVVGGAGFVGSALVRRLIDAAPRRLVIVDNLLSADIGNVPEHPTVDFVLGSIADDRVLSALPRDLDYVFHLACYHGNQSSIHDPLADHDNNTMTSLKLFEWLKDCRSLKKVVYAAAGCAVAEKTFEEASGHRRRRPGLAVSRQPVFDLQADRRDVWQLLFQPLRAAVCEGALPERVRPGRDPRRRTLARHAAHGMAQRDPDLRLEGAAPRRRCRSRTAASPAATSSLSKTSRAGLIACAERGAPGEAYNLASGVETTILDLARADQRADRQPDADRAGAGARLGSFGPPFRRSEQGARAARVFRRDSAARRARRDDRMDAAPMRDTIRRCMLQHARFVPGLRAALA